MARPGAKWAVFSGTGRELEKNASAAHAASWAQPSGLSIGGETLYVADSESSTVRAVSLGDEMNPTRTLAGGDGVMAENLFAFGDRDGRGAKAKFQHPLAVLADEQRGVVFVADSYNHKIKTVDGSGVARTFCGKGKPGFSDGVGASAEFWEPSGLAFSGDHKTIYVADTNNGAIRMIDVDSKRVSTLDVVEGAGTAVKQQERPLIGNRRRATVTATEEGVGKQSVIAVVVDLPAGSHFTPGTTNRFQGSVVRGRGDDKSYSIVESGAVSSDVETNSCTFQVDLGNAAKAPSTEDFIEVESLVYYCGDDDGVCRSDGHVFQFNVIKGGSKQEVSLRRVIPVPKKKMSVSANNN